jgi:hypothetical protein
MKSLRQSWFRNLLHFGANVPTPVLLMALDAYESGANDYVNIVALCTAGPRSHHIIDCGNNGLEPHNQRKYQTLLAMAVIIKPSR